MTSVLWICQEVDLIAVCHVFGWFVGLFSENLVMTPVHSCKIQVIVTFIAENLRNICYDTLYQSANIIIVYFAVLIKMPRYMFEIVQKMLVRVRKYLFLCLLVLLLNNDDCAKQVMQEIKFRKNNCVIYFQLFGNGYFTTLLCLKWKDKNASKA